MLGNKKFVRECPSWAGAPNLFKRKKPLLLGIEPRISSLGGKRLIHWATGV